MGTVPRIEQRTWPCAETRLDRRPTAGVRCRRPSGLCIVAAIFAALVVPDAFATPPAGTPVTNQATASFDDAAHSSRTAQSNTAILTVGELQVSNESATPITVSLTVSSTSVAPMSTLTYTLVAGNTRSVDAAGADLVIDGTATTAVVVRDALPAHTTFRSFNVATPAGVRVLYHIVGTAAQTYVTQPPDKQC